MEVECLLLCYRLSFIDRCQLRRIQLLQSLVAAAVAASGYSGVFRPTIQQRSGGTGCTIYLRRWEVTEQRERERRAQGEVDRGAADQAVSLGAEEQADSEEGNKFEGTPRTEQGVQRNCPSASKVNSVGKFAGGYGFFQTDYAVDLLENERRRGEWRGRLGQRNRAQEALTGAWF